MDAVATLLCPLLGGPVGGGRVGWVYVSARWMERRGRFIAHSPLLASPLPILSMFLAGEKRQKQGSYHGKEKEGWEQKYPFGVPMSSHSFPEPVSYVQSSGFMRLQTHPQIQLFHVGRKMQ